MGIARLRTRRKGGEESLVGIMREMGWEAKEARRAIRCVFAAIRVWMLSMAAGIDTRVSSQLTLRGIGSLSWITSTRTGWTRWIWASHGKIKQAEIAASKQSANIMVEARKKVREGREEIIEPVEYLRLIRNEYQKMIYDEYGKDAS